ALRKLGQLEGLVGGDRVLDAGNGRLDGPSSGGDENVLRRHATLADRHRVRVDELRRALDCLDAYLGEAIGIDLREPGDLAVLFRYQRGPGKRRALDRPAVAARVLEVLGVVCRIGKELLRHAAADHAGAADAVVLGDGHPGAQVVRNAARPDTAGAGADGEQV